MFCLRSLVYFFKDTRTHVVVELYDNERTYVESLQILVTVSKKVPNGQLFCNLGIIEISGAAEKSRKCKSSRLDSRR